MGSFPTGKSSTGIMDLAGNASEWTADWYEATFYQKSPDRNPTGPEAPTGERVVRGGSWSDPDYVLLSSPDRPDGSSSKRLGLLFGERASCRLTENDGWVTATVVLPQVPA